MSGIVQKFVFLNGLPIATELISRYERSSMSQGVKLRAYQFLDSLQPQLTSHICTTCRGYFPVPGMASLFVEIAPGMAIHRLIDRALKATDVQPATLIVERAFGMLEVHHDDKGQVLAAGAAILDQLGVTEADRIKPRVVSNTIIRSIEPYHAMIVDKIRFGSMINPGESLLVMETQPAAYVAFAANEAEKAADIEMLEVITFGAFGRMWLGGNEEEINQAKLRVEAVLADMDGRANEAKTTSF